MASRINGPDNAERVLASTSSTTSTMALDGAPMKSLLPGHTCQTLFSWFRVQNKSYQHDDPVHGLEVVIDSVIFKRFVSENRMYEGS
jgi:hypothetical protein